MEDHVKKEAVRRLAIAEGHVKKIRAMVESEAYCPDVIHQSQAVQSALKRVDQIMLHGHLHSCVLGDVHGSVKEKITQEVVSLFKRE